MCSMLGKGLQNYEGSFEMTDGTGGPSPRDISLHFDLINHSWDNTASGDFLVKYSQLTRENMDCILDVRVGPREQEKIDIFPASTPGAPILLFVHGGWWRGLTRKEWSFTAIGFVKRGYTVVLSDYALCPHVGVPDISNATRAAVVWVYENAASINGDRDRIFLSGHSAGGQQAAMMAVTDWTQYGLPADVLRGVVAMSAIFDMRPFRSSWLQPYLQLSSEMAARESALLNIPKGYAPPVLVTVGEEEAIGFYDQAETFVEAWQARGHSVEFYPVPLEDHGSAVFTMSDPESLLCTRMSNFFDKL
jgi:arylformamidase